MTTDTSSSDTSSRDTGATDGRGPAAGWFVQAHVDQLLDNPADPRGGDRDQATLVEFANSMRSVGLLQALTVVPALAVSNGVDGVHGSERFVIYAGHRRRDAARLAADQLLAEALGHDVTADPTLAALDIDLDACGADEVGAEVVAAADRLRWLPCLVRPDLAAEVGMEIATGLIENGIREDLTSGQRARSAEQLSLAEGWDLTRVATATGLTRAQARAAAALPRLGETARQAAYRGDLSLEHAAVLDELGADGATDTELGMLARGGSMFEHHVTELRKTLRRRSAAAELRDEADRRGWTVFDEPDGYPLDSVLAPLWSLSRAEDPDGSPLLARDGEDADPTGSPVASPFAAMPDHGVLLHNDPWADPRLEVVCADPDAHGYRRSPHSTLYVDPGLDPDTAPAAEAETGAETGADTAQPPAEDEPDHHTDTDTDHDTGAGHDGDCDDARQGGGSAGDDVAGAAESDLEAEAERKRRPGQDAARDEQRRAEAAAAAQEVARVAAERAAERAAENERFEAERAARQARRDALETAADTRWRHTTGLLRTQKGAGAHVELPAVVLARFPWLLADADEAAHRDEVAALCAEPDRNPSSGAQRWSSGRVTHRAVVITAWLLDQNLAGAVLDGPTVELGEAEPAVWWLDYLTGHGYQPAEVETEARAALGEVITVGLAHEYGEGSSAGEHDAAEGDGSV